MAETLSTEPSLILDQTHENYALFSGLNEFARDNPHRFLIALGQLGDIGIAHTQPGEGPSGPGEVELLRYIFENRLDHDLEFDDATEEFLASDPEQLKLIAKMQNQRARVPGKNERVRVEDNPGALHYRDIIRRRRVAVLAVRQLAWQEASQTPSAIEVPPIPRQAAPYQTKPSVGATA